MEVMSKLSDQAGNLQNWQQKSNFAVEDEVNGLILKHFQALGYDIGALFSTTCYAGAAMLSKDIPPKHLYSFDAAYFLARGEETLVLLGEVKHSLEVKDVKDFDRKVSLFKMRLGKIRAGEMPIGSERFNAQNKALEQYIGAQVKGFLATVHVKPKALAAAAERGFDIVLPGGARLEVVSADEAKLLAESWSVGAPAGLQEMEDEC